jgi:hypothetical protein
MFLAPQVWPKPLKRASAENALILAYFNHSLPSHHGIQKEVILDEVFDHRCMPSFLAKHTVITLNPKSSKNNATEEVPYLHFLSELLRKSLPKEGLFQ